MVLNLGCYWSSPRNRDTLAGMLASRACQPENVGSGATSERPSPQSRRQSRRPGAASPLGHLGYMVGGIQPAHPAPVFDEGHLPKTMSVKKERLSERAHVLRDKRGLVNRTRRLRGQVDAIERALDGEASCSDLLQRITAARGAINGLMAEVLEEHVREYLIEPQEADGISREEAAEELIEIIHSYLT